MYSISEIERNLLVSANTNNGKPWMLTASGNTLFFDNPQLDQISLFDFCHHLGNICRYTGAVSRFYSVAQHLLLSAAIAQQAMNQEAAIDRHSVEYFDQLLAVILHDAEEAYVNDLSSPLKRAISPSKYKWIAVAIRQKVYEKYGVDWRYHNDTVKHADLNALIVERAILMPQSNAWPKMPRDRLFCTHLPYMSPAEASEHLEVQIKDLIQKRDAAKAEERRAAADRSPTA